jgi:predicted transcriptional regulator of viral defense system
VKAERLTQLRRGLYLLAPPYRRVEPHPFLVAGRLVRTSYVSCQSALEHHGLIPEHVPVVTSVTTGRPARLSTPLGCFQYHHVKTSLFWGFEPTRLGGGQQAFVATPAKAVLDLLHLVPSSAAPAYLRELRLASDDHLDLGELVANARRTGSPKLCRAAAVLADQLSGERQEWVAL